MLKPKRILHVNGAMNLGGTDTMIMNIFRNIDRSKFQFDFLYYTNDKCFFDDEILKLGGKIFRMAPPRNGTYLKFIRNVRNIIKNEGPFDAVHVHTMLNSGLVAYAAKKEKVPLIIVHAHSTKGSDKQSLLYKIYEKSMKSCIRKNSNYFIACGKDAGEYLFGRKIFSKVTIIPNAINIENYQNVNVVDIKSFKKNIGLSENTFIIGQIGSLKDVKNHKFSIKIAKLLKQSGIDFCMFFIGEGVNRRCLEKMIIENNLSKNIKLLGNRTDIPLLLKMMDVLIMPSLYEGIPVTLIEAQAAGTPSIISNNISSEVDFKLGLIKILELDEAI